MAKKPNGKNVSPELALAEERIEVIKSEIAQAMVRRNALPKSASDEDKAAAVARVEQLQAEHQMAVQTAQAIMREATTKLEQEHKRKKQRRKQLRASRQPRGHAAPHEDPVAPQARTFVHRPLDRAAEEAQMDAANEEDLILERQRLEAEDGESANELAHQWGIAEKKRRKEEAAERTEAKKREEKEAQAMAEAARLDAEKEARAKIRQQAALQRAEETRAKKRQQCAELEARQRAAQDAPSSWSFSGVLRQLRKLFGGSR